MASVICHVDYALKNQMQPYVDFLDSPTFYNDGEIAGTRNYGSITLNPYPKLRAMIWERQKSFLRPWFPWWLRLHLTKQRRIISRTQHLINVRTNVAECLQSNSHLVGKILRVQFRGQEIKYLEDIICHQQRNKCVILWSAYWKVQFQQRIRRKRRSKPHRLHIRRITCASKIQNAFRLNGQTHSKTGWAP